MRIAIIGMGLIGGSVALAARRAWPDATIVEIDQGDSLDLASPADLVVVATPVDSIIDIVKHHAHRFGDAAVVDTGSTKRAIVTAARQARLANFVGGHPLAGGATSGRAGARADMFDRKRWFLVPADPSSGAVAVAQRFIEGLGAQPVVLTDDGAEHDRVMAAVSHLPQVVAAALLTVSGDAVGERGLQWSGSGLKDTTRLAASSATMWESILSTNASELRPLLLEMAQSLQTIAKDLDNSRMVRDLFERANRYRDMVD